MRTNTCDFTQTPVNKQVKTSSFNPFWVIPALIPTALAMADKDPYLVQNVVGTSSEEELDHETLQQYLAAASKANDSRFNILSVFCYGAAKLSCHLLLQVADGLL